MWPCGRVLWRWSYVERRGVEAERREWEEGWRAEVNEKVHL